MGFKFSFLEVRTKKGHFTYSQLELRTLFSLSAFSEVQVDRKILKEALLTFSSFSSSVLPEIHHMTVAVDLSLRLSRRKCPSIRDFLSSEIND